MATVGWARRLAMDIAAQWAQPGGVLMTTDADGRLAPDWATEHLALLDRGAHLVCGRVVQEGAEEVSAPSCIASSEAIERAYTDLSIELDARIDPRAHDPWPHHGRASGASLAIRARDYRVIGRMPTLPAGEGRAFAAQAERQDLCIRHSDAPTVTVSRRLHGCSHSGADGALADSADSAERRPAQDRFADERLVPAATAARRAAYRGALREAWSSDGDTGHIMRQIGVPTSQIARPR